MDDGKERVVFVEFNDDGSPYEVMTTEGERYNVYDFALSKRYGLLYHESGSAPHSTLTVYQSYRAGQPVTTSYWASSEVIVEEIGTTVRLDVLPEDYTPEKLFDAIECEGQLVWCSDCGDWMPDSTSDLCEHVWYCVCGEISTPDERCTCKTE